MNTSDPDPARRATYSAAVGPASRQPRPPASGFRFRFSRPAVCVAGTSLVAGIVSGGAIYLGRSPQREVHVTGTDAFWPHVMLYVLAALVAVMVLRRSGTQSPRLLLAPLGSTAAHRLAWTVRSIFRRLSALPRLLLSVIPLAMLVYFPYRCGMQVLGGLDPNFVVNAWGGPTYFGAMAFHYMDGALLAAVSAGLLNLLLLPARTEPAQR